MSSAQSPNPARVAIAVLAAMRRRSPDPTGRGQVDHSPLNPVLAAVAADGVAALGAVRNELRRYRTGLERIDPDTLTRNEALAYWLNLYNAGALDLAAEALARADATVLRVPGAFRRPWAAVAGEDLSLNDIEHGKLRRMRDGRIHAALVCGSASCPTLRHEAYEGSDIDRQLEDQMRSFLRAGGAVTDRTGGALLLSRVFLWYGADVVKPHRMPTWLPVSRRRLFDSLRRWLDPEVVAWVEATHARIAFQAYDWSLACAVR
jgi:hypothetical protein